MRKKVEIRLSEHEWPFPSARLNIAIFQLECSFPGSKHISVIENRETFVWRDLADMDSRIARAVELVRSLHKLHPELNLFVFPDYSLPLQRGYSSMQQVADETGTIIVSGSDNISQASGEIYAQSFIVRPGSTVPLIVTKATLSRW